MRKSVPDLATDKIIQMREKVKVKLLAEYKGTRPYRQEPVTPREQLYAYSQMTPEVLMALRQSMGDDVINEYLGKMGKLKQRYAQEGQ